MRINIVALFNHVRLWGPRPQPAPPPAKPKPQSLLSNPPARWLWRAVAHGRPCNVGGRGSFCRAATKSEARALFKERLGIRRGRLPGYIQVMLVPETVCPAVPCKGSCGCAVEQLPDR